jgi:hypothetical protein
MKLKHKINELKKLKKMKTNIKFDDKIKQATIIVHKDTIETFNSFLKKIGGDIIQEHTPESRKDDNYVFVVKDIPLSKLFPMPTGMVYKLSLTKGNISAIINFSDNGNVDYVYVEFNYNVKSKEICTVRGERSILAKHPTEYVINWGGWGSQNIETSKMFTDGMQVAVQLCEEFTEQYCLNTVQTN